MDVPYVIVKSKSRLGQIVHKKTATALVLEDVRAEDQASLTRIIELARREFNENKDSYLAWGGGRLSAKAALAIKRNLEKSRESKQLMREQKRREREIREQQLLMMQAEQAAAAVQDAPAQEQPDAEAQPAEIQEDN